MSFPKVHKVMVLRGMLYFNLTTYNSLLDLNLIWLKLAVHTHFTVQRQVAQAFISFLIDSYVQN